MRWTQNLVMTLVYISKTLNHDCFSSPRGKLVPTRAEMVLVIDLARCSTYLAAQAVYSPGSSGDLRHDEINGTVIGVMLFGRHECKCMLDFSALQQATFHYY